MRIPFQGALVPIPRNGIVGVGDIPIYDRGLGFDATTARAQAIRAWLHAMAKDERKLYIIRVAVGGGDLRRVAPN
jgi:hypothetical protein